MGCRGGYPPYPLEGAGPSSPGGQGAGDQEQTPHEGSGEEGVASDRKWTLVIMHKLGLTTTVQHTKYPVHVC